jgi:hypothetical protein
MACYETSLLYHGQVASAEMHRSSQCAALMLVISRAFLLAIELHFLCGIAGAHKNGKIRVFAPGCFFVDNYFG